MKMLEMVLIVAALAALFGLAWLLLQLLVLD